MTHKSDKNEFNFNADGHADTVQNAVKNINLPGQYPIDSYGNMGFRFAEMSHQGSLLILPSGTSVWSAIDDQRLKLAQFDKILAEANHIDILILGLGEKMYMPPKEIRNACSKANIVIEFMSTSNAARTYNVLLAEDRRIAAALIAIQ